MGFPRLLLIRGSILRSVEFSALVYVIGVWAGLNRSVKVQASGVEQKIIICDSLAFKVG